VSSSLFVQRHRAATVLSLSKGVALIVPPHSSPLRLVLAPLAPFIGITSTRLRRSPSMRVSP
jgi:hypothetical protein